MEGVYCEIMCELRKRMRICVITGVESSSPFHGSCELILISVEIDPTP